MKLSGEQFQQIISQLVSDEQDGPQNKRLEPRVGIRAQGFIVPCMRDGRAGRQIGVTIRDLSRAGLGILAPAPMLKGMRFSLCLGRAEQTTLLAHYEVRHCKTLTESLYSIGAHLVNIAESGDKAPAA